MSASDNPFLTPQPTKLPPPPSDAATLNQLQEMVHKETEERAKEYNKLPTSAEFAKLESDVRHLWRYVAVLVTVLVVAVTVYIHLDGKISSLNGKVSSESKYLLDTFQNLENSVNDDVRAMNNRVDQIILRNHELKLTAPPPKGTTNNTKN